MTHDRREKNQRREDRQYGVIREGRGSLKGLVLQQIPIRSREDAAHGGGCHSLWMQLPQQAPVFIAVTLRAGPDVPETRLMYLDSTLLHYESASPIP